jgi:hypothetical protein
MAHGIFGTDADENELSPVFRRRSITAILQLDFAS